MVNMMNNVSDFIIRDKDGNTLMKFDKVGNISISYGVDSAINCSFDANSAEIVKNELSKPMEASDQQQPHIKTSKFSKKEKTFIEI